MGGSALAIRLQHRVSEDLDLTYVGLKLPRGHLEALQRRAEEAGLRLAPTDDVAAVEEFAMRGLDLRDYQQDFVANDTVKLSFFTADNALAKILHEPGMPTVRVASLSELFKAKCLVSAVRSKTRDWLDLYILLRQHGFTFTDYQQAFLEAKIGSQFDTALGRICSGVPQRDDEGYLHLLPNPPPLEQIVEFFRTERDRFEIERATQSKRAHKQQGS